MGEPIDILLIEDHPIVREACRGLLAGRADLAPLEAGSAEEALALNRTALPSVVLLDLELPDSNGLDIIATLRAENPRTRVVVFSMHRSVTCVTKALQAGARGYVTKSDDPETLRIAIDKVLAGTIYLGPSVAQDLALARVEPSSDPLGRLSARERQVVALLGEGKSLAEISAALEIGYKSAANVVSTVKQKLGIPTSAALIKFAVEQRAKA